MSKIKRKFLYLKKIRLKKLYREIFELIFKSTKYDESMPKHQSQFETPAYNGYCYNYYIHI